MAEEKPGRALAERLRADIEQADAAERQAALSRQRKESSARQRRVALMGDLEAFARAIGHLRITHRWGTLTLRFRGHTLRFKADGGEVIVSGEALSSPWRCRFEPTLAKWVLQTETERILLFDAGLERLMRQGLKLG